TQEQLGDALTQLGEATPVTRKHTLQALKRVSQSLDLLSRLIEHVRRSPRRDSPDRRDDTEILVSPTEDIDQKLKRIRQVSNRAFQIIDQLRSLGAERLNDLRTDAPDVLHNRPGQRRNRPRKFRQLRLNRCQILDRGLDATEQVLNARLELLVPENPLD